MKLGKIFCVVLFLLFILISEQNVFSLKTFNLKSFLKGHDGDVKKEIQDFVDQIRKELGYKGLISVKKMRSSDETYYNMSSRVRFFSTPILILSEPFFESLSLQEKRFFIGHAIVKIQKTFLHTISKNILRFTPYFITYYYRDIIQQEFFDKSFRRFEKEADLQAAAVVGAEFGIKYFSRGSGWFFNFSRPPQDDNRHYSSQERAEYLRDFKKNNNCFHHSFGSKLYDLFIMGHVIPESWYNFLDKQNDNLNKVIDRLVDRLIDKLQQMKKNNESTLFYSSVYKGSLSASTVARARLIQKNMGLEDRNVDLIALDKSASTCADSMTIYINDFLSEQKSDFFIAHEFAHIKNHHVTKIQIGKFFKIACFVFLVNKMVSIYSSYLENQIDMLTVRKLNCLQGALDYFDRVKREQLQMSRFKRFRKFKTHESFQTISKRRSYLESNSRSNI